MKRHIRRYLPFCFFVCLLAGTGLAEARNSQTTIETVLQTSESWDGTRYGHYPTRQPQITVLKISIPAHTALDWHTHPMINAAYVLSGHLVVEIKGTGKRKTIHAGEALAECVDTVHRGYTTNEPAELIVFYAGEVGMPLSMKAL